MAINSPYRKAIIINGTTYKHDHVEVVKEEEYIACDIYKDSEENEIKQYRENVTQELGFNLKHTLQGIINSLEKTMWDMFSDIYFGINDKEIEIHVSKSNYFILKLFENLNKNSPSTSESEVLKILSHALDKILKSMVRFYPDFDTDKSLERIFNCPQIKEYPSFEQAVENKLEKDNIFQTLS